jgi:hypothetical protein
MDMRFKDPVDLVVLLFNHQEQRVGGMRADNLSSCIIVQDRIDNDSRLRRWIGDHVLPSSCLLFIDAVDNRILRNMCLGAV